MHRALRQLVGDPARALAHLANELGACLIVVGTRLPGIRAGAHEFFAGSVAVHSAHRQHRPIAIIPVSPVPHGTKLSWETT
ncbi:universal stress protein [Microbacterium sp. STN6]|uniref:universal stress protein n=1 Tax=Microbacterium sp. STN6 TaxID=2995588 RepID=UPI002260BFC5|nr:universal stress protein [Microbacterium sp. STN6]MCX7520861.1 universal stress protein [Microbacterium sp. STN6]